MPNAAFDPIQPMAVNDPDDVREVFLAAWDLAALDRDEAASLRPVERVLHHSPADASRSSDRAERQVTQAMVLVFAGKDREHGPPALAEQFPDGWRQAPIST